MTTDKYLHLVYDKNSYNCLHFARDVWMDLTGTDIKIRLDNLFCPLKDRRIFTGNRKGFTELSSPKDPCLVLMQRPYGSPHIGVYFQYRVLHIREERGVEYQPLDIASCGFRDVRYFLPC